jgi:uncharacterized protein YndB with AHSA1/START domain
MSPAQKIIARVTRRFEASAERVFDAFLDPAKAGRFLFATPTGTMVRVEIDARVGGAFTFVDRRGDEDAVHIGEYLELDRPRRLVFSFSADPAEAPSRVEIDIVAAGGGCEVILTHEMAPEWADFLDRTRDGWTCILEGLARTL